MSRVSTLIPVYNGELFIREAVDSALAQTHQDHEVIVIDDGSTDSTPAILENYGEKIKVLRQENGGHVNARNNGAKIATGDWIAFLDADDAWASEKLEKQLNLVDESIGLVYTDRQNFGETDRVKGRGSDSYKLWEGDLFEPLLLHGNFVTVASVMIRRDWYDRLNGFDEVLRVVEDWDMWLRFSAAGGLAKVAREPLTFYRWHLNSMSNDQNKMCNGRLIVLNRALDSERGQMLPDSVRRMAKAVTWQCSAWHAVPWNRAKALEWYARSAYYCPSKLGIYKEMLKCIIGRT